MYNCSFFLFHFYANTLNFNVIVWIQIYNAHSEICILKKWTQVHCTRAHTDTHTLSIEAAYYTCITILFYLLHILLATYICERTYVRYVRASNFSLILFTTYVKYTACTARATCVWFAISCFGLLTTISNTMYGVTIITQLLLQSKQLLCWYSIWSDLTQDQRAHDEESHWYRKHGCTRC